MTGINMLFTVAVSLLSVYVSHKISESWELKKAINLLKLEIATNLNLCDALLELFQKDLELNKQGQTIADPFPTLHNIAWNTIAGIFATEYPEKAIEINSVYVAISQINKVIEHLNSMKPGRPAGALVGIDKIRIKMLEACIGWIKEKLKPNIRKILRLVTELERRGTS